jgi:uncharacterized phage-associated protein
VDALTIAKYFLYKANQEGDLITNLKMQKLLYYAQAWYLVNFGRTLFDDQILAWDLGPVIKNVYNKFKKFRHTPILFDDDCKEILKKFKKEDLRFLDEFYDQFIEYSAHDLVNMSHNEEPWKKAHKTASKIIDPYMMKIFYTKLYEKSSKK